MDERLNGVSIETMNKKSHGLMFHHFHGKNHLRGQGSISERQLEKIIDYYIESYKILPAKEWLCKADSGSLNNNEVCITFDDTLLCQFDIALPVLESYNLTAFWFIYSSVLEKNIEMHEVYRKYRMEYFESIDKFYKAYFLTIDDSILKRKVKFSLKDYSHYHDMWKGFSFYSENDTKFRFIRDSILDKNEYACIMSQMMEKHEIDLEDYSKNLWMTNNNIKKLHEEGHVIGLHSHTHPTMIAKLSDLEQAQEYNANFNYLYEITGEKPITVSHPCNSYNSSTLKILDNLGIKIGFRANMEKGNHSLLEYPRQDHSNIIEMIGA